MRIVYLLITLVGFHNLSASDLKKLVIEQHELDFNQIEPFTCASYNELIERAEQNKMACIIACVECNQQTHYFAADYCNKAVFSGQLYPHDQDYRAPLLHPFIHAPITKPIEYFVLSVHGNSYLGNHLDLTAQTQQGDFMRLLFDAQYHENPITKAQSQFNLAITYHDSSSPLHNMRKAIDWYEHVAEQTAETQVQAKALYTLAHIYNDQQNYTKAHDYFLSAARQHADQMSQTLAHLGLAELYRFGKGVQINYAQAEKHYLWIIEQLTHDHAQMLAYTGLGELYRIGGNGIQQNFAKAAQQYEKVLNCPDCNLNAIAHYGFAAMYQEGGMGIARNFAQAHDHYVQAAKQDANKKIQTIAQCELGELCRLGGFGMASNPEQAAAWYQKALEQTVDIRSRDRATVGLADLYQSGLMGTCKDGTCSRDLYMKIASTSSSCAFGQACCGLGILYTTGGTGIEKNMAQAIAWYQKVIDECNNSACKARAYQELAHLYRTGIDGMGKNSLKAVELYTKAASQTADLKISLQAHETLGSMYRNGDGDVEKNLGKAIDCFSEIVEHAEDIVTKNRAKTVLHELQQKTQLLMNRTEGLLKNN